ncbi:MAG: hypothetical protein NZM35_01585 [Chitinophagales bacterium]|nr:hypothetical protein [Chitinophagales bacterium]MDW8418195.1 shikimate kinase [Chitinophagales bacterium]
MRVYLIGFMGAGKTTLGQELARKLNVSFCDTDLLVCRDTGYESISDLIASRGMDFFRLAERDALRKTGRDCGVVATGGGTPCYFDNLEWMLQSGVVVYVCMDVDALFLRLSNTNLATRPLLAGKNENELRMYIYDTLAAREQYYLRAHITYEPLRETLDHLIYKINHFHLSHIPS